MRAKPITTLPAAITALVLLACPSWACAQDGIIGPEAISADFDLRASATGGETGWLDGGYGKLYEGGDDGDTQARLRLAYADLVWEPRFSFNLSGKASLTYQDRSHPAVDLNEAYLEWRSNPAPTRFGLRAGAMWPPVSQEHGGGAWLVEDSITPSAANSWIGEEVKVLAVEGTVERRFGEHRLKLTGAGFLHNDISGTLLFYRGWALDDFRATVHNYNPLPPLAPAAQPYQVRQSNSFWELDDRAGYYARIDYTPPLPFTLNLFRYDNLGDHVSRRDNQIQWHTRFWNAGIAAALGDSTTAKAQVLWGNTLAGPETPFGIPGDADFTAAYLLLGREFGSGKVTLRGDWFEVHDNTFVASNDNNEYGWAAMVAYKRPLADFLTLLVELQHVSSDRPGRQLYGGIPAEQAQTSLQTSLRFGF
ncbi:hypothetical protein GRI89_09195 [Altererythrobacter salegens]|uniref:Alginate export domain-containing protein n=1 Tax=Croceibacterium salegens TaxID=1737568 RepID=A0A6I4SV33_9SPHN|nr:hypothetical protein [Croceibacterium salegens]MXO59713.1 hypothetical protein [Croceibacterium salegens]